MSTMENLLLYILIKKCLFAVDKGKQRHAERDTCVLYDRQEVAEGFFERLSHKSSVKPL